MTPTELMWHFDSIIGKARAIMLAKNHDYRGGSGDPFANFKGSTALGISPILGILLRMQDKMMRIKTFSEKGELLVQDEGVENAIIDIIDYAVLVSAMIEDTKEIAPEEKA